MTEGTWRVLRGLVDWVIRGEVRHYLFSKVMSWVALDRGIRMAEELGLESDTAAWKTARATLHDEIMERGWSERHQSFASATSRRRSPTSP
ncbi:MAG: glycoside hydrolase family 15 protein [Gemmatimonadales bacterium]